MNAAQLISEFAKVLNESGPDSPEAAEFIKQHSNDAEFVELAHISIALKRALMPQQPGNGNPQLENAEMAGR
jgi:hypothetical protein